MLYWRSGEEEELESIRGKILNSEKIANNLEEASSQIGGYAIDAISEAVRALEKIEGIDKKYEISLNTIKSIYYDIQELSRDIDAYKDETYFDEEERNRIETRLDLIYVLKRKYGNNVEEILKYGEEVKTRIEKIENSENYVNSLKKDLKEIIGKLDILSYKMHEYRLKTANFLSQGINNELSDLEMKNAKFLVEIEYDENKNFGANGLDKIRFMISTNIGEDEKPLAKIASGGEMSRIMLAIKVVLANVDTIPVMIFDEIDTGISGTAAKAVSEKMKKISSIHQLICITHLAVITAKADYNYLIKKEVSNNNTKTFIKTLNESETLMEIARISSGEITDIALEI